MPLSPQGSSCRWSNLTSMGSGARRRSSCGTLPDRAWRSSAVRVPLRVGVHRFNPCPRVGRHPRHRFAGGVRAGCVRRMDGAASRPRNLADRRRDALRDRIRRVRLPAGAARRRHDRDGRGPTPRPLAGVGRGLPAGRTARSRLPVSRTRTSPRPIGAWCAKRGAERGRRARSTPPWVLSIQVSSRTRSNATVATSSWTAPGPRIEGCSTARTWQRSKPGTRRQLPSSSKAGPWPNADRGARDLCSYSSSCCSRGPELRAAGFLSADHVHLVTECAKLAFADREAWYADPDFADVPLDDLLARDYAWHVASSWAIAPRWSTVPGLRATAIRDCRSHQGERSPRVTGPGTGAQAVGEVRGDTVHVAAVDRHGNMVACTPSGGWLQSSPVIEGLGFCLGTRAPDAESRSASPEPSRGRKATAYDAHSVARAARRRAPACFRHPRR